MKRWFKRWLCDFWYKKHEYEFDCDVVKNGERVNRVYYCKKCDQRMIESL